ncbi:MAG: hypothetical protein OXI27_00560 [Thaumarchaeota archaeon]|nr:hypothetical protein [Nitrososphaerota archaeon]
MALIVKISRGAKYLYFQAGPKSLYIAPQGDPSKAKQENVVKALEYTRERINHYNASFDELLQFLPAKERKQHAKI